MIYVYVQPPINSSTAVATAAAAALFLTTPHFPWHGGLPALTLGGLRHSHAARLPALLVPPAGLMPTVLLGSAVGAAVVYGIDEGDPMAMQKKVRVL
jgi:hypothetical protein